jgi:hypothetical protein
MANVTVAHKVAAIPHTRKTAPFDRARVHRDTFTDNTNTAIANFETRRFTPEAEIVGRPSQRRKGIDCALCADACLPHDIDMRKQTAFWPYADTGAYNAVGTDGNLPLR